MRSVRAWPLWLLMPLTLVALLPWSPQGPFDARTLTVPTGVHLQFPWVGILFEPLLAPAHMVTGAPDFRLAMVSIALWAVVIPLLAGLLTGRGWGRLRRGLGWAGGALGLWLLYVLFMALLHLPGWRLAVDDPDVIVADLQSHTIGSHDGLVTAEENLQWHRERGYDVVAVTEHKLPQGSFAAQALALRRPELPGVIPGVEVRAEEEEFLLGLGIQRGKEVLPFVGNQSDYARRFIDDIHCQGGAVVALSWLLEPPLVEKLARLGIDGIELANTGHPDTPEALREAMLAVSNRSVLMIASTDWHGWSGFTRTWTLVRVPGAAAMDNQAKAQAVVEALKSRQSGAVTPVITGRMGTPPAWRWIAAPLVEPVRYAAELSPARVAAWWIWAAGIAAAARVLRRRRLRPWPTFGAIAGALLGAAVAWRAVALLALRVDGAAHAYAVEMGSPALAVALAGVVAALLLMRREWRLSRAAPRR